MGTDEDNGLQLPVRNRAEYACACGRPDRLGEHGDDCRRTCSGFRAVWHAATAFWIYVCASLVFIIGSSKFSVNCRRNAQT